MRSAASSACARVSATTAATASPCQQARSIAIACWGGDLMPLRCPSTATHGLQYFSSARPHHRDHARHALRLGEIELPDARVGMRAPEERHVREARQPQVVHVDAAPLQQALRVGARDALADVAAV